MDAHIDLGQQPFTLSARERAAAAVAALSNAVSPEEEILYAGMATRSRRSGVLVVTAERLLWCAASGRGVKELTTTGDDQEPVQIAVRRRRAAPIGGGDVISIGNDWKLSDWEGDDLPEILRGWVRRISGRPSVHAVGDESAGDAPSAPPADPFEALWRQLDEAGDPGVPAVVHTALAPTGYVRLGDGTVVAARAVGDVSIGVGDAIHIQRSPGEPLLVGVLAPAPTITETERL